MIYMLRCCNNLIHRISFIIYYYISIEIRLKWKNASKANKQNVVSPNHSKPPYLNYGKFWNVTYKSSHLHPEGLTYSCPSLTKLPTAIARGNGRGTKDFWDGCIFFANYGMVAPTFGAVQHPTPAALVLTSYVFFLIHLF